MNATDFRVGQRVQMTDEARNIFGGSSTGEITGYSRNKQMIRVLRDGTTTAINYGPRFWRPADPCCDSTGDMDICLACRGIFCDRCMVTHECGEVRRVG